MITSLPFTNMVDTRQATDDANDPVLSCADGGGGKTVWYSFTSASDVFVSVSTIGSSPNDYDTALGIFTGSCGSLVEILCNDDVDLGVVRQSEIKFMAQAGVTYIIHVAEWNGGGPSGGVPTGGDLVFSINQAYGFASVSQGVTVSPDPVTLGQNFRLDFTLHEVQGAPITFESVTCAILNSNGNFLFDFTTSNNVTVQANGIWQYSETGILFTPTPPGTYQAVARGKVVGGNWFDFTTTDSGVSPKSFQAVQPTENITVTSPNGGESWQVGSTQTITWTSTGNSGIVDIALSTNGGTSYTPLFTNTTDDGSQAWTIPNSPSTDCLIRITDNDGMPSDVSNAAFSITTNASCPEWLVPITVTDGNHVYSLRFGGDPNASDGFDSGCDVTAAPPGFSYYAYFSTQPPINYLSTDIRGWTPPFDADIDWNLRITNADGITSEICWDSDALPAEGSFSLKGSGLAVDMRAQACAQTSGNATLTIEYRSQASVSYNFSVSSGAWYLISLPVIPADRTVQSLFPGATAAFGWDYQNQSYFSATELEPQRAYWLLMLQPDTVKVSGLPLDSYTKNYTTPGWDLAGSVLQPSPIADTPAGSVIAMFGWNATTQSYIQIASRQAEPLQGYWILVYNTPSSISVGNGSAASFAASGAYQAPAAFYQKYGALPPPPPTALSQDHAQVLPKDFGLSQNYPNPFNPETVIEYQLPEAGQVGLRVYSILGQEVRTLVNHAMPAGYHRVTWDGKNDSGQPLESGIYLYELRIGPLVKVKKTVLLK